MAQLTMLVAKLGRTPDSPESALSGGHDNHEENGGEVDGGGSLHCLQREQWSEVNE
jgi:hypothetical protein